MDIVDVRIKRTKNTGNMLACASINFDNEFVVHDIKIINGVDGLFVAMPNRKNVNDNFVDICHPLNQKTRDRIQKAVLQKYEAEGQEE